MAVFLNIAALLCQIKHTRDGLGLGAGALV